VREPPKPFVPLGRMLEAVAASGGILTAFDCGGPKAEYVQGVLAVCRRLEAPALFLAWKGSVKQYGLKPLVATIGALAEEAGVPACLHLDHSEDPDDCRAAIDAGFGSVMLDGASKPFDENVSLVRELVGYASARGVTVEGALGGLGREGGSEEEESLTDPALAESFVRDSGVHVLSPSVGNRHGLVGRTVPLDWRLIGELSRRVPVPMALHGGSGIALADARRAAGCGFRKLNLATMLHAEFDSAVKAFIRENPAKGQFAWSAAGRKAVESMAERYLSTLGVSGAARALR
jgi:ketose-bisphosphate aldolase